MKNKKVITGLSLGVVGVAAISIVAEDAMQALERDEVLKLQESMKAKDLRSRALTRVASSAKLNGSYYIDENGVCYFSKLDLAVVSAPMVEGEEITKVQLVTDAELLDDGTYGYPETDGGSEGETPGAPDGSDTGGGSENSGGSGSDTETGSGSDTGSQEGTDPSGFSRSKTADSIGDSVVRTLADTSAPLKDTVISEFEGNEGILSLSASVDCADLRIKYIINGDESDAEYATVSELIPDLADISSYAVDSEAPVVSFKEFNGDVSDNGIITRNGNLLFDVTDNLGVDATKIVTITDTEEITSVFKDGVLSINTNQFEDGEVNIQIKVYDLAGNEGTLTHSIQLLREAPPITGESHTKAEMVGGITFIKSSMTVKLGGWDNEKIKSIDLLKGETVIQNITDGTFDISSSGEHRIKVTDIANNVTIYRLEDLFSDLSSDITVDGAVPEYAVTVNGEGVSDSWYTEATNINIEATDNSGIKNISAKVYYSDTDYHTAETIGNGSQTANLQIDLANDVERSKTGIYRIELTVEDMAGNADHATIEVKADFDNPTIENAKLQGNYHIKDGKLFLSGEAVLNAELKDIGSGVDLLNVYKDGELISTELPVTLDGSGHYTFRVSDKSGRVSKEYSLGDLLGLDDTSISDIVIDKEAPVITEVSGFSPDLVDGENWFKAYPNLRVNVSDSNLESVSATINGKDVSMTDEGNGVYSIDTSNVDGLAKLIITAKDKAENQSTFSYDYAVDKDAPNNIKGSINREGKHRFGTMFYDGILSISISGEDFVGIDSFLVDDQRVSDSVYTVETGEHFVTAIDKLGNTTKPLGLGSITGLDSDTFVIDETAPIIDCSRPSGDIDNWYNSDVTYKAKITDEVGIYSASVKVNGEEVSSFSAKQAGELSVDLEASTSKVQSQAGQYTIEVEVEDNAGNKSTWSDTIFIDKEAPKVDKFEFTGNGAFEGVNINGTNRYGFFFTGSATCDIYISDGEVSSGIKEAVVTLSPENASPHQQRVKVSNGVARVSIPEDFKGTIEAYAVDNVNNVGEANRPDGVVTESSNAHINSVSINLNLPQTGYTDLSGNSLYNTDVDVTADLGCSKSGLRSVEWGVNGETRGSINIDADGNSSGNFSALTTKGKNLVLDMNGTLNVAGNENGMNIWVKLTDRAGHVSETSRTISIDKDVPVITVTWDNSEADGFYNRPRTATVSIQERNFDPNQVQFTGSYGTLGTWSNDGTTWRNTLTFSEDNQYQFGITCTDRAGNSAQAYNSESFTIDKTAPVITVSWDNNSAVNGNYYKNARTATITIKENNFDESRINYSGTGTLSGWTSSNGVHTSRLVFNKDGKHEFSISCTDKADNQSNSYSESSFTIDQGTPELTISGVQNGISYKKNFGFTVSMKDALLDKSKTQVKLVGRRNGEIEVDGVVNDTTGMYELTSFPEDDKYDDIYTLTAKVTDMAGNSKEESLVFSLNRYGSKYSFSDGTLLGNYINKPKKVEVIEKNIDQLDTSKARVAVIKDGKELTLEDSLIDVKESEGEEGFDYTYTIEKEAFENDGKYQVQIYSKAVEGTDYSNVSQEYEFVLDSKDPEIIVSGVKEGGRYNEYQRKVSIDVRDTYGVKDIEVLLNGQKINLEKKDGIYSFDVKEGKGTQELKVVALDMAGNKTTKKVSNFFISSNALEFLVNQLWFKIGVGAVLAFLAIIIGLIIKNIHDSKKKEATTLDEHEALYRATVGSTGLGTTSSSESFKDEAGNLDSGDIEIGAVTTSSDLEVQSDDTDATTTQV